MMAPALGNDMELTSPNCAARQAFTHPPKHDVSANCGQAAPPHQEHAKLLDQRSKEVLVLPPRAAHFRSKAAKLRKLWAQTHEMRRLGTPRARSS